MRWVGILMMAACAAPAAERLPAPVLAKGEVPLPPMPAYGGAQRIGACAIRLEPAGPLESVQREHAIRARLPAGASVKLTDLHDRAAVVRMPLPPLKRPLRPVQARLFAEHFVRDTAEIWGATRGASGSNAARDDEGRWVIELSATPRETTEWDRRSLLVVVRIDERHGRLEAGLARAIDPAVPICDGPRPALDRNRLRAAVIASGRWHDEDVDEPLPWLDVHDRVVRWLALVPVGHGARAHMSDVDPQMRRAAIEELFLVDPATAQILGSRRMPPAELDFVDDRDAATDAATVLGP